MDCLAESATPSESETITAEPGREVAGGEKQVASAGESPHATGAGAREAGDPRLGAAGPRDRDASVKGEVDAGEVQAVSGGLLQLELNHLLRSASRRARKARAVVSGDAGVQEVGEGH